MMRFFPSIGDFSVVGTSDHIYFYVSGASIQESESVQLWTNLPPAGPTSDSVDAWHAISLSALPASNQAELGSVEKTRLDFVVLNVESSLDRSKTYEYTYRKIDHITGTITWFGDGRNGEISFESSNSAPLVRFQSDGDIEHTLIEVREALEGSRSERAHTECYFFKRIFERDDVTLPLRLFHPISGCNSALALTQRLGQGQIAIALFARPSSNGTPAHFVTDNIITAGDIARALDSHKIVKKPAGTRWIVTSSDGVQHLVTHEELLKDLEASLLLSRTIERVVLGPGEYALITASQVYEISASARSGGALSVAFLGSGKINEAHVVLDPRTSVELRATSTFQDTDSQPLEFPSIVSSVPHQSSAVPQRTPRPTPRVLLPIALFHSIFGPVSKNKKSDLVRDLIKFVGDILHHPLATVFKEVREILALAMWFLGSILLLNSTATTHSNLKGFFMSKSDVLDQNRAETLNIAHENLVATSTLVITLPSLVDPLHLFFPPPSATSKLHSTVQIKCNEALVKDEYVNTELRKEGMTVILDLSAYSREGDSVVEISC